MVAALVAGAGTVGPRMVMDRPWKEGSVRGRWTTVFTGCGEVTGGDDAVELSPKAPQRTEGTHAALVTTTRPYRDFTLSLRVNTRRQLRPGAPNPWEVAWVLWHYASPQHFYALVLKPNGWEISKQDAAYPQGQRFLASGNTPTFPVGTGHTVGVVQIGDVAKVSVDGRLLTAVTDTERPYLSGSVGLYTEDAQVTFGSFSMAELN